MGHVIGLILAAGYGTRLRPFTDTLPKALMPVAGVPAFEYATRSFLDSMDSSQDHSLSAIGVNTHHHAEKLETYLAERPPSRIPLRSFHENEILGTAGGIRAMARRFAELGHSPEHYLVTNADMLAIPDWKLALARHHDSESAATMMVWTPPKGSPTAVYVDNEQVLDLLSTQKIHPGNSDFLGASILSREFAESLPESGCLVRDALIPHLSQQRRIDAFGYQGPAIDIGTPERYWRANLGRLQREAPLPPYSHASVRIRDLASECTQRHGSRILEGAIIHDGVVLADSCEIGTDSVIGPCVVAGDNVSIGPGTRIRRSVVLPGSKIAENQDIENAIVSTAGIQAMSG